MMTKISVRRRDRDAVRKTDEEPETKKSISEMLEERRLDEMEKKLDAERADKLDAIVKQLQRPIVARDLQSKTGGEGPGLIDRFFDGGATGEN